MSGIAGCDDFRDRNECVADASPHWDGHELILHSTHEPRLLQHPSTLQTYTTAPMNRGLLRGAARLAGVVCLAQPTPSRFSASASASTPVVRTHLLQLAVSGDKQKDIAGAVRAIGRTAGASDLVVLPECWNCPYSNDAFGAYVIAPSLLSPSPCCYRHAATTTPTHEPTSP